MDFKNHKLTVIEAWNNKTGNGEYIFKEEGTGMYSMHIIFRPNTIIVYGDTQPNVIFRQGGIDLPWLNGAVASPDYLFSKVVGNIQQYDAHESKMYARNLLMVYEDEESNKVINYDEIDALINDVDWAFEQQAVDFYESHFEDYYPQYTFNHLKVLAKGLSMFSKAIMEQGD